MKIIKSVKEINYNYFGLDMFKNPDGDYFVKIQDIFIKPRPDESTQIYLIFRIVLDGAIQLKSQMFYFSSNPESRFDQFFYHIGMNMDINHWGWEGYAFDHLIGKTGIIRIENEISKGNEFSNVISFTPLSVERWKQEWALAYGYQRSAESSDENSKSDE